MSEGRGSAFSPMNMVTMVSLLCLLLLADHANAKSHIVGGPKKWSFNIKEWPEGKEFKAGEYLRFKWSRGKHNVVQVDENGYNNCETPVGAKVFTSGKVSIRLRGGMNYFICNRPGHCGLGGMKIAIDAAKY